MGNYIENYIQTILWSVTRCVRTNVFMMKATILGRAEYWEAGDPLVSLVPSHMAINCFQVISPSVC